MFEKIRRWVRFNLLYLGRPPWDTGVSPPELKTFLSSRDPGRTLDMGCGPGTNLLTMAKAGFQGRVIHGDITGDLDFKSLLILCWILDVIIPCQPRLGRINTKISEGDCRRRGFL